MKKILTTTVLSLAVATSIANAHVADLLEVYHAALQNDPQFQQALAQRDIEQQELPLSTAALLPQLDLQGDADYEKLKTHGNNIFNSSTGTYSSVSATNNTKDLGFTVTLSQSIFNFTNWMSLASARNTVKAAYATYTAAVQTLIQQTINAYFAVLLAKETLDDTGAEKRAFYRQYIQAKESFDVGVTTITDVYNAEAAYDTAIAKYVTAENNLEDSKENLRAITGVYYPHLADINLLPLVKPAPANINKWSQTATRYNWTLIAANYSMLSDRDAIKASFGGHLPSLNLDGTYSNTYTENTNAPGNNRTEESEIGLQLNVPVYSGGEVTAQVKQAIAQYDLAAGQYQQTYRSTINDTRQAYLGAISGINVIQADKQTIKSNESTLEGMEEGYKVGTQTMTNVLIAEAQLYDSEKQYASDRNSYINSLIDLKLAAGTLTIDDVVQLNSYLSAKVSNIPIKKLLDKHYKNFAATSRKTSITQQLAIKKSSLYSKRTKQILLNQT